MEFGPGVRHDEYHGGGRSTKGLAYGAANYSYQLTDNTKFIQGVSALANEETTLNSESALNVAINDRFTARGLHRDLQQQTAGLSAEEHRYHHFGHAGLRPVTSSAQTLSKPIIDGLFIPAALLHNLLKIFTTPIDDFSNSLILYVYTVIIIQPWGMLDFDSEWSATHR